MDFVSCLSSEFLSINRFLIIIISENMGEEANEERAQQMYEKSMKIEQQFGDLLTGKQMNEVGSIV